MDESAEEVAAAYAVCAARFVGMDPVAAVGWAQGRGRGGAGAGCSVPRVEGENVLGRLFVDRSGKEAGALRRRATEVEDAGRLEKPRHKAVWRARPVGRVLRVALQEPRFLAPSLQLEERG